MDEEIKNKDSRPLSRLERLIPAIILLTVELLLLITFNLANIGTVYRVIAIILAILLLPLLLKGSKHPVKEIIVLLIPVFLLGIAAVLSPVFGSPGDGQYYSNQVYLNNGVFDLIFIFFGSLAFVILGYSMRKISVRKEIVVITILTGFGILLTFNLVGTIYNYGIFHRLIYADKISFYQGKPYEIADSASALIGFEYIDVNYTYITTQAVIVLSAALAFLFIDRNEDKRIKYIIGGASVIALLTLINFADFIAFLFVLPSVIFALLVRFKLLNKKYIKTTLIIVSSIVGILVVVGVFASLKVGFIETLLNSNPITKKLYYNSYTTKYMATISRIFNLKYFFGDTAKSFNYTLVDYVDSFPTGNLILDVGKTKGVIGLVGIIAFIYMLIKQARQYFSKSEDKLYLKYIIIAMLITIVIRYMLFNPYSFYTYNDLYFHIDNHSFIQSSTFAVAAFMLGFMSKDKEVVPEVLENLNNEVESKYEQ